jgi:hypothetical protein
LGHIPGGIRPENAVFNKKQVDLVPFGMGDLGKLETPGCRLIVIFTQYK